MEARISMPLSTVKQPSKSSIAMKRKFQIRLGTPDDVDQIAEVYADSVRELCKGDYEPEVIAHWATSTPPESRLKSIESGALWVAEVDGKIGGYLVSVPGELLALFVASSCAGLGMGKTLGQLGIKIAKENASGEVKLESTLTAAPFYKTLGFEEVDRGYFSHGNSGLKIPVINMVLS